MGLTKSQIRVYFAVVRLGEATAGTISTFSNVAHQDVYRLLTDVCKLGLIEKVIAKPVRFRVAPLKGGLRVLFEAKNREMTALRAKTIELAKKLAQIKVITEAQTETYEFVEISKESSLLGVALAENRIQNCQLIKILTSHWRLNYWATAYPEEIRKAIREGIRIKILVDKPQSISKSAKKGINKILNNILIEFRYTSAEPLVQFVLVDNKETYLVTSQLDTAAGLLSKLYSNHPSMAELVNNYFDINWNAAPEHNEENDQEETFSQTQLHNKQVMGLQTA